MPLCPSLTRSPACRSASRRYATSTLRLSDLFRKFLEQLLHLSYLALFQAPINIHLISPQCANNSPARASSSSCGSRQKKNTAPPPMMPARRERRWPSPACRISFLFRPQRFDNNTSHLTVSRRRTGHNRRGSTAVQWDCECSQR